MVIKKCNKWWQYIGLTEKPNRTESNRFGSVLQKLTKIEPNRPVLTPNQQQYSLFFSCTPSQTCNYEALATRYAELRCTSFAPANIWEVYDVFWWWIPSLASTVSTSWQQIELPAFPFHKLRLYSSGSWVLGWWKQWDGCSTLGQQQF